MGKEITRTRARGRTWGSGTIMEVPLKSGRTSYRVQISIPGQGIRRKQFQYREDAEVYRGKLQKERFLALIGEKPQPKPEDTITLGQLLTEYLRYRERESKANTPGTLKTYKGQAKYWLKRLGNIPIGEIRRADVSAILQGISERTSGPTANRYLALLRKALNWAVEREYLEVNPIKGIKQYKENPGRLRWLEPHEAERLLNECQHNPRLFMFTATALYTGMRRGEIERLRWQDINFERDTITIPKSKTGEGRTIPLEAPLKRLLETWSRTGELVLGSFTHKKAFMTACRRAGLKDFHFHDLRHTYASWKAMAGVDPLTLSALLGHKTLAMVKRYAHLAPEHLERARGRGIPEFNHNLTITENEAEVKVNAGLD